jgi:hypothetical protein
MLIASFTVDRRLLHRTVHFDVERRAGFRRAIFFASLLTMATLTFLLVFRQPFPWALSMVLMFVVLHIIQIVVPYQLTRRTVRQYERAGRWPLTCGENHVEVSVTKLDVKAGGERRTWPLDEVADAFYLGDTLLICPEPGVAVPIPRTADFGSDNFQSFCRTFVLRLRGVR